MKKQAVANVVLRKGARYAVQLPSIKAPLTRDGLSNRCPTAETATASRLGARGGCRLEGSPTEGQKYRLLERASTFRQIAVHQSGKLPNARELLFLGKPQERLDRSDPFNSV
jgi:hypothetical protein